ncbi:hypothetical protein GCM10011391_03240 [Pullulanibacillus camelliae]|uniref:WYL domain-containing protein n=1 Tax=Pullulanibacillus camelliae TaxID=1707096 RepID=A0A8J2YA06_9BACL|nr:WYL domain-containing protein [Pullulanibacillus camelliae]GGE28078.1 hypothetical protein GCM10011391_03240 [Pullulanibacillus camelliae]
MLVAYCDLRQDIRHFRLSQMTELRERFGFPMHFKLSQYTPPDDRSLLVRIRFDHDITDKVKESNYHYIVDMEEHQDGFHVILRVRHLDEVLQWVLGWGADAVVLEPKALQNRIREEAQKILRRY